MVQQDPPTKQTTAPPTARRFSVRRGLLSAVAAVAVLGLVTGLVELHADQQPAAAPASVGLAADAGQFAAPAAQPGLAKPAGSHGASGTHAGKSVPVTIQNYAFAPATLTVNVGDTVTWTNQDTAPHTVTVSDGPEKFASPNLQKGDTYSHTFTKAGTYQYYCAVHPDMKASVTAQDGPPPTTTPAPPSSSSSTPPPTSTSPDPGSDCAAKASLQAIWMHLQSAHLEESPGQQVQDLLNLDQWVKTHTVWLEHVIGPEVNGGPNTVEGVLTPLIMHVQSAHLDEGLGQQVTDLLNTDQWVKNHTVLIGQMLAPALAQTTC